MYAIACGWFVTCDHAADGLRTHPILGAVSICDRCAETVGEPITEDERAALRAELEELMRR